MLRRIFTLVVLLVIGGVGLAFLAVSLAPAAESIRTSGDFLLDKKADPESLPPLEQNSKVYAHDGTLLAEFHAEINRKPIPLAEIPQVMQEAALAAEDATFFKHKGIDIRSIGRAFLANFESGGVEQGGSTITQQVVKNEFLTPERSFKRKVREAFMSVRLERNVPKATILERYLNTVYLGNGAYGVQVAAEVYFGKSAKDLALPEVAILAGQIAAPYRFDPFVHPEAAKGRRSWVLHRMAKLGRIDQKALEAAEATPLPEQRHSTKLPPGSHDYFVEAVKQELLNGTILQGDKKARYHQIFKGGISIYTTLDPRLQALAQQTVESRVPVGKKWTAALASVDVKTGGVVALYGGRSFQEEKFDLAKQGKRQTGSSMKTFVLAAALERGYSPFDVIDGSSGCQYKGAGRSSIGDFPDSHGGGPMTLWQGTYNSVNCVFVNLVNAIGAQAVVDMAHKMGVTDPLEPYPSIALGGLTRGLAPLDMAGAYASLASGGIKRQAHLIEKVVDVGGKAIYQANVGAEAAMNPNTAAAVTLVLRDVLTKGTAKGKGIGRPSAGKTGTTNGSTDAWFVGYTPQLSTAVWVGNPRRRIPIRNFAGYGGAMFGGKLPAELWHNYMTAASAPWPVEDFPAPNLGAFRKGRQVGPVKKKSKKGEPAPDALDLPGVKGKGRRRQQDVPDDAGPQGTFPPAP